MENPGMQFCVGKAVLKNDSSFELSLRFDNVQGAGNAVDAINMVQETIKCPNAFNGLQLASACVQLAGTAYSAIKNARQR